jgi:hypothetical protein
MKPISRMTTRCLLLITLSLLPFFVPMATAPAQAAPGYAYYWSLTFDYTNNFNGLLYVEVGYNQDGGVQNPPLHSASYPVSCQRVGNVGLAGGVAKFGGGYLACDLDLKRALEKTFSQCNDLFPGCTLAIEEVEKYGSFRMMANVLSPSTEVAPLFYHEDAAFTVMPELSTARIAAALTPVGMAESSSQPAALGAPQSYEARYLCDAAVTCKMAFAISGAVESMAHGNALVEFSTPATRVYIGYNPDTGLTIPAGTQLAHLFVDPPNFGNN